LRGATKYAYYKYCPYLGIGKQPTSFYFYIVGAMGKSAKSHKRVVSIYFLTLAMILKIDHRCNSQRS
jgi:hypothetical protein